MKRHLWSFLLLALAFLLIAYIVPPLGVSEKFHRWFSRDNAIAVKVAQVKKGEIELVVRGRGELRSLRGADVVSQIGGVIAEVRFKVGDFVRAGQVIATVRASELLQRIEQTEAALSVAEANWRVKESQLGNIEKQLEKTRELHRSNLISNNELMAVERDVETHRAHKELAYAQVEQHKAGLAQLRYLLGFSDLVAPFDGVITRLFLAPGANVENSVPILTITALDPLKVTVTIPSDTLTFIRPGLVAYIGIEGSEAGELEGKVVSLHTHSEVADRSAAAEIHLPNRDRRLAPGMTVSVSLHPDEKRTALLAPKTAIVQAEGKTYVYTIVDEKVERKTLTTGWEQDETVEIVSGVDEGEWLVIEPHPSLKPGAKVQAVAGG